MPLLERLEERQIIVRAPLADTVVGAALTRATKEEPHGEGARLAGVHLAAADLRLRYLLVTGGPLTRPLRPTLADGLVAGVSWDCCPLDLSHLERWEGLATLLRTFTFVGDMAKAPPDLLNERDILDALDGHVSRMAETISDTYQVPEDQVSLYRAFQSTIWVAQLVLAEGPNVVGLRSEDEAADAIRDRYFPDTEDPARIPAPSF
jgi:hypothetical protein